MSAGKSQRNKGRRDWSGESFATDFPLNRFEYFKVASDV